MIEHDFVLFGSTIQSTLPRRERHGIVDDILANIISIHAPAKGAT